MKVNLFQSYTMKKSNEANILAKYINIFLNKYIITQKVYSQHTLKSFKDALSLYVCFLETEKK
jgi:hypothetical protein